MDLAAVELPNILAIVLEKDASLPMLLKVLDFTVVDFALRVLDRRLSNQRIVDPLACDFLARGNRQSALPVKFLAQKSSVIGISVVEIKETFNLEFFGILPSK